ncbi:MAG TPA: cytochrome-c oxidase, cbb3-type subunit II [Gammaproteobacteria bacterium]|nr:cytochrome-c oxidase, cbb3-type subunit II [Gammaproteobacteria bacterium]
MKHETIERNIAIMIIFIVIAISFGGLAEILPLLFQKQVTEADPNLKPLQALALAGRDIYIREGCHVCHTQMVRALYSDTKRYGPYVEAGEQVYEHPFLWGSKRIGPDLARVGKRYTDLWHQLHLLNPRSVVPTSIMPSFPWLSTTPLEKNSIANKMRALRRVGVPYSEAQINDAENAIQDKTELTALIAYLQQLGTLKSLQND